MTFCFYGDIYSAFNGLPRGGGEKQLALIIKVLSAKHHKIYVLDWQIDRIKKVNNIIFLPLRKTKSKFSYIPIWLIVSLFVYRLSFDICFTRIRGHLHFLPALITRLKGKKFIYSIASDLDVASFKKRFTYFYKEKGFWFFLKSGIPTELLFPLVIRLATNILKQYEDQIIIPNKKAILFPNLFDVKSQSINILNDHSNGPFIFIGSIDKRKGVKELYEIIVSSNPTNKFILIGKSRDQEGKVLVNTLKNLKNIEILDHLSNISVLEILSKAKALISTSKMEGFPNVFLESWYCGTPVISLYVNPGLVLDQYNLGFFCSGSVPVLIDSIEKNNFTPFDSAHLRQYVVDHHNADSIIDSLLKIIA